MKVFIAIACLAAAATAQETSVGVDTQSAQEHKLVQEKVLIMSGDPVVGGIAGAVGGLPGGIGPGNVAFATTGGGFVSYMGVEASIEGKPVTGAPYSADLVTETTRTLADGNRIANKSTSSFYRDSQGRTRREMSLKMIGPFAPSGDAPKTIVINDPVANVSYTLEPNSHRARKISTAVSSEDLVNQKQMMLEKHMAEIKARANLSETKMVTRRVSDNSQTEQLGDQNIGGVVAQGTRITRTIPAGQIGNERAIEIVTETWYSPELKTVVLRKTTNPIEGDTVFQLTNIQRSEPPASMFELPPGYTVSEEGPAAFKFHINNKEE